MKYALLILLVLFATNLDIYLFRAEILPIRPALLFIPLFVGLSILNNHANWYLKATKTHTFFFLLIFSLLLIIYGAISPSTTEIITTEIANGFISLVIYMMALIFFYKSDEKFVVTFFTLSVIIFGLSIWYDTFYGLVHTQENLRKGGFADNPNVGASAIKFLGFCLLIAVTNNKHRLIVFFGLLATIFVTFSRGGFITMVLFSVLLLLNQWRPKFAINAKTIIPTLFKMFGLLTLAYMVLVGVALFIQSEIPSFAEGEAGQRIDMLLGKSKKGIISSEDKSEYGREDIVVKYFDMFKDNPFGYGTGFTSDKDLNYRNTHNFYLTFAIEYGFIGILLLLWYLFYSIYKSFKLDYYYYFVFFVLLLFEGLVSNTTFSEKPIIIAMAFLDSRLYPINNKTT